METRSWLGFEDEEHEGGARAEYRDFDEQSDLSRDEEAGHDEYVRRVAEEFGFPLSDWTPTIPSRERT
jgi:hypothetical protein